MRSPPSKRLSALVDALPGRGRYTIARAEALRELASTPEALEAAVRRLAAKHRIVVPRRGFYVVVPPEYQSAGAPPPDWFIDDLMSFEAKPYYVGLLSAAALHGAAHHQPQEFQVVTDSPLRPTRAGRARIRFFMKRHLSTTPVIQVKTQTGTMRVSSPEATAIDLVRYARAAGHLGNVATVLADLAERLDANKLLHAAQCDVELTHIQRLGHLLDAVGAEEVARPLATWVAEQRPRHVLLRPDASQPTGKDDPRWRVVVNETIELDL
ncbi:MAG TPA: type IV toxin-antitoxin system AbiEi family antitoxin [Armatimonadota bacterium]